MYQHEFAKRMVALPGSRDYGRLSITVQYHADVEILEVVPRSAFSAPPKVDSAIVRLVPRPPPYEVKDVDFFMKFITAAFSQRRKKLRNAILNNAGFSQDQGECIGKTSQKYDDRRRKQFLRRIFQCLLKYLLMKGYKYHK